LTVKAACSALLLVVLMAACAAPGSVPSASTGTAEPTAAPSADVAIAPCAATPGRSTTIHWKIDHVERSALVHPGASVAGPAPILLALHGYGGWGQELEQISDLSIAADDHRWLVVYPEGRDRPQSWTYDPSDTVGHAADVAFLRRIIEDLVAAGCGDPERVVVTGISQGGWLSDMAGCELSDLIVGVVPVAARGFGWTCEPKRHVAFAAVSGELDDVLPYEGGPVNAPDPITSVESVDAWLADRATSRGCEGEPTETRQSQNVAVQVWSGCDAPVSLYRVKDGGHSWPGGGGMHPVSHSLEVNDIIAAMLQSTS
jgi:polyhydroxybutyrate depolymerase